MKFDFTLLIQIASISAILVPILIGIMRAGKTTGALFRLFLAFLIVGFLTDCFMFTLYQLKKYEYLLTILNIYSLIEAIFFYWYVRQRLPVGRLRTVAKALLAVIPFLWLTLAILYASSVITQGAATQIFDTTYEITVAFLSGYALLKLVEQNDPPLSMPSFWILLGIFFYCFCTFFIMAFIYTMLSLKIWFLNNIVNILTYGFYSVGMWKYKLYRDLSMSEKEQIS